MADENADCAKDQHGENNLEFGRVQGGWFHGWILGFFERYVIRTGVRAGEQGSHQVIPEEDWL
jgi:hypothetical protein